MPFPSILLLVFGFPFFDPVHCNLLSITAENHDEVMQNSRLTFLSFTASWCPFSKSLLSNFAEAAAVYKEKYPNRKTIWGNVDCIIETNLAQRYAIYKYPTMKVYFYGYMMTEYRGSRQVNALIEYVEKMENTTNLVNLHEAESLTQWQNYVAPPKGTLILWFPRSSPPFELILKAISLIHDRLTVVVPVHSNSLEHEEHQLWFSLDGEHVQQFNGSVTNFKEIEEWVKLKSQGMVRELTFENMEEFAEDGRPLLILIRRQNDTEAEKKFVEAIRRELDEKTLVRINPLLGNGDVLTAVLHHFNKNVDDLPFLLIDQFVHSFLAPWSGDEIYAKGNIKRFVDDLFNENLHRKLHQEADDLLRKILAETEKIEKMFEAASTQTTEKPRESVFKKVKPSISRYSFAKEEL